MKNIFITGGTSGIGWELAKLYLKEGHRVGVCGRDLSKLPEEAKSFKKLFTYEVSVTDAPKLREYIELFGKEGLDILIANAGVSHGSKSQWPDEERTRVVLETNLQGALNAFFPAMEIFKVQKRGHLVGIASVAGFVGLPGASAYSASKGALIKLCETFAIDLPKYGIHTTTICPGFIDTPLTRKNDHPMPFLISGPEGALRIKSAIDNKKVMYVFPKRMALIMHILLRLPRSLYRFIMKLPVANYSKREVAK